MAMPPEQPLPTRRERAALFGGSFDPVHRGHLAMATAAKEAAGLERVVFIPAARSPFKAGTAASPAQRLAMLRIALAESGMPGAELSDFELGRPAPSYSWETVRHFAERFPETDWHWILGADQWEQIERWAEPEILRCSLRFLVLARRGSKVADRSGWRHLVVPFDDPASSTAIREGFAAHRGWLTPGVAAFCEGQGLYGASR
jgi:nicotinate-nucleotide adenylyltransferase